MIDNPLQALEFLKKNLDKFNAIKRNEIRSKIVEKLDSYGKEFLTRQAFEGEYVNFEEPSDSDGYTILNIDKIETAISYIAESTSCGNPRDRGQFLRQGTILVAKSSGVSKGTSLRQE